MLKATDKLDKIALSGMKFYGYHGCLTEERETGQEFYVDVNLALSLRRAGKSDELKNTVNYAAVFEIVKSVVEGQSYHLIEAVAEHIADLVLEEYPEVRTIEVTVHKPAAPLPGHFQDAAVTIRRNQKPAEEEEKKAATAAEDSAK
ncbi:dihydroneopterin aldolase [uncultured Selenomonas sp.]|uniref:dihydroneopterin aldolase n=1 Tax=uncultured Selenomonas sp. TaxID=159275 RepID=UPI0025EC514E|nr:dihydroneopterin aldolase [uncultured Selenomonas sp.]